MNICAKLQNFVGTSQNSIQFPLLVRSQAEWHDLMTQKSSTSEQPNSIPIQVIAVDDSDIPLSITSESFTTPAPPSPSILQKRLLDQVLDDDDNK